MKKFVSICLVAILCLGLSVPAAALGTCHETHLHLLSTGYCNGDGVNVRTGPGTNYKSLGLAYKKDVYHDYQTTRKDAGNWCHVHGKHIGWMHQRYYTATAPASIVDEKA